MTGRSVIAEAFAAVGLSRECAQIWWIILDHPDAVATDVCAATGLLESGVRECIEALVSAGFLRAYDCVPLKVRAADPSVVIETYLVRREREAAERVAELASLRALIPPLFEQFPRGGARGPRSTGFELIESLDEIRRELYLAMERVQSDVRTLDPGVLTAEGNLAALQHGKQAQFEALARGIRDRSILDAGILTDPSVVAIHAEFRTRGALLRTLPDVACRVTIVDRALAFLAIDPRQNKGALVIRVPSLIDSLIFMFDHIWPAARPVFELDESDIPTSRGPRLLEFMAAGMKDEKIARALGVGPRTIRRDISELKQALGVSSRTEIVAAAAKRGWL